MLSSQPHKLPNFMFIFQNFDLKNPKLVGGWTNPFEKYARQFGSFPQGSGWTLKKFETSKNPKPHEISRQHLASLLCNEHRMLELRRPFGIFCGHRPAIRPGDPFICAFSQDRFDGKSGAQLHLPGERRHHGVCVPMFKPILKVLYSEMYPWKHGSKKSPTGPTEWTPKLEYLLALVPYLGVRW